MLKLIFEKPGRSKRILCLGAHCDDIEIGCGGSLLQLSSKERDVHIKWIVFTSNQERKKEAMRAAENFLKDFQKKEISILEFPDGNLPYVGQEVKKYFEKLKYDFDPDVIFTHFRMDMHQDHRLINELTWNTFRNHLILEYEIPKYDGDLGSPNFFMPIDSDLVEKKIQLILENYTSQTKKPWFEKETFLSILRIRGMESASETKYSEGFYVRKAILKH